MREIGVVDSIRGVDFVSVYFAGLNVSGVFVGEFEDVWRHSADGVYEFVGVEIGFGGSEKAKAGDGLGSGIFRRRPSDCDGRGRFRFAGVTDELRFAR